MKLPIFGRKRTRETTIAKSPLPLHPGPDDDGIARIFPKEMWDDSSGDILRKLRKSLDDYTNIIPTQETVQARHEEKLEQLEHFVAEMNRTAPAGVRVVPYAMLPWTMWQGRHGSFLMAALDMFPAQPWNNMLLADGERDSILMELPVHPRSYPPGLIEGANKALGQLSNEFDAMARAAGERLAQAGGATSMGAYADEVGLFQQRVMRIGHQFAITTFGREVYDRHTAMFGRQLGWNSVRL